MWWIGGNPVGRLQGRHRGVVCGKRRVALGEWSCGEVARGMVATDWDVFMCRTSSGRYTCHHKTPRSMVSLTVFCSRTTSS